ncbi:MAG: hypothetical protein AAF849_02100 [Bacteroidota bacterium]
MKYFTAFLLVWLPFAFFAQKTPADFPTIDTRLSEVFELDYLERLQKENPFLIQRWNFYLDHAFYITKDDKLARNNYPSIRIDDLDNINILKLEKTQALKRKYQGESSYQIEGTDLVLVYHSAQSFNQKLNEYLGRKNVSD